MNIENISKGQIFKNYKHLCQELDESIKAGKSKQLQLKEWKRYFSYSKDGNKFIVTEIYETPFEKVENRGGANHLLPHAYKMENIFLHLLNTNNGKLSLTMNTLLRKMEMVNSNFKYGSRNKRKVSKYLNIKPAFLEEFFVATKRTLSDNIESMMNRLEKEKVIKWHTIKMVRIVKATNVINEFGEIALDSETIVDEYDNEEVKYSAKILTTENFRPATNEEIELIKEIEDDTMEELNCKNKQEIVVKDRWREFRNIVNRTLKNRANIQFYYDSYEIEKIGDYKPVEQEDVLTLNHNVQHQLLTNWERRQQKALEKGKSKLIRIDEQYIPNANKFIDVFVNVEYENIVEELTKIK
ncbi:hypothetical protein [Peribacillus asahii]|uniref:hypothetical protein n=1 Tax=Peribacillus asahii TaxID=228899 RepID=UPI00207A920B|nr:hypothetical protein [Peribacillus asahii]USK86168.1 hypothetical protein LIT35_05870 [Peribacillus asahii]